MKKGRNFARRYSLRRVRWNRVGILILLLLIGTRFISHKVSIATKKEKSDQVATICSENVITFDTPCGYYSERLQRLVSFEDLYLLEMIACSEAGVESYEGKVAVVATVLNRLETGDFGNTFYEVIFQKEQFSSATNGIFHNGENVLNWNDIAPETRDEADRAVSAALSGEDPTLAVGGALFFYNPTYCSDEENAKRESISDTIQIGNHIFYRVWD